MLQRWLCLAAACFAAPALAEVTPLPEEVTSVVDCTNAGTIALVKTDDGGDIRGGWWKTSDPNDVELCPLLAGGTFVDPSDFSDTNGANILGTADGGAGGFPTVPVLCKSGSTVQIQYRATPVNREGHGDVCTPNGNRLWSSFLFSANNWRISLNDGNGVDVWNLSDDGNNGFLVNSASILITGCSDDGTICCGWYTRTAAPTVRLAFCCDTTETDDEFENCFTGTGADATGIGEARCVSADGSTVVVWNSQTDETFLTNPSDPSGNLVKIADGQPLFCNEDASVVVGFETQGGDDIGWTWTSSDDRADIAPPTGYDGTAPTCSNSDCTVLGGILSNGADAGYLWKEGVHGAFSCLTACRDSLDLPFTGYVFGETSCVNEGGRTFYCTGEYPGGDETCFYCKLDSGPRFVWNEDARFYPPYITEYSFYAYFYSIYANAQGGNAYTEIAVAYCNYSYLYDAPCREFEYDYWQRTEAVDDYESLRYTQFLFAYYGYLYNYYGPILGAQPNQYTQLAQAYALYSAQFLLEEL